MDREPHLRVVRVSEDADEDCVLAVPDGIDPGEALQEQDDHPLRTLRYEDQSPWRCGECNQPVLPGWARCPVCGRFREDCET